LHELIRSEEVAALPDLARELEEMTQDVGPELPRIRIEHSPSGAHRMFLDRGESFLEGDNDEKWMPENQVSGIVVTAVHVRAFFVDGEALPRCSASGETLLVEDPVAKSCRVCPEAHLGAGRCKPKVKLLVLSETGELKAFPLSPTSIKHWNGYVRKLGRSKLPFIAVVTRFTLQDVQKNGFRWAEVKPEVVRLVTEGELAQVREIRKQLEGFDHQIEARDYEDPGDRQKKGES
jgi:hypothetical protein